MAENRPFGASEAPHLSAPLSCCWWEHLSGRSRQVFGGGVFDVFEGDGLANSTGGCDISAMMAGQHATQPTGGGFQYGTAIVSRRACSDRGDGPIVKGAGIEPAASGSKVRRSAS